MSDTAILTVLGPKRPVTLPVKPLQRTRALAQVAVLEALYRNDEAAMLQGFADLEATLRPGVRAADVWHIGLLRLAFMETIQKAPKLTLFEKHFQFLRKRLPWRRGPLCGLAQAALYWKAYGLYTTLVLHTSFMQRELLGMNTREPWLPWHVKWSFRRSEDFALAMVDLVLRVQTRLPDIAVDWDKFRHALQLDMLYPSTRLLLWHRMPKNTIWPLGTGGRNTVLNFARMLRVPIHWKTKFYSDPPPMTPAVFDALEAFCTQVQTVLTESATSAMAESKSDTDTGQQQEQDIPSISQAVHAYVYSSEVQGFLDIDITRYIVARWPTAFPDDILLKMTPSKRCANLQFLWSRDCSINRRLELIEFLLARSQTVTGSMWKELMDANETQHEYLPCMLRLLQHLLPRFVDGSLDKTALPPGIVFRTDGTNHKPWDTACFYGALELLEVLPSLAQSCATYAARHNVVQAYDRVAATTAELGLPPVHVPRDLFPYLARYLNGYTKENPAFVDTWIARKPQDDAAWFTAFPSFWPLAQTWYRYDVDVDRTALPDSCIRAIRTMWQCQSWPEPVLLRTLDDALRVGMSLLDLFGLFGRDSILAAWSQPSGAASLCKWYDAHCLCNIGALATGCWDGYRAKDTFQAWTKLQAALPDAAAVEMDRIRERVMASIPKKRRQFYY